MAIYVKLFMFTENRWKRFTFPMALCLKSLFMYKILKNRLSLYNDFSSVTFSSLFASSVKDFILLSFIAKMNSISSKF